MRINYNNYNHDENKLNINNYKTDCNERIEIEIEIMFSTGNIPSIVLIITLILRVCFLHPPLLPHFYSYLMFVLGSLSFYLLVFIPHTSYFPRTSSIDSVNNLFPLFLHRKIMNLTLLPSLLPLDLEVPLDLEEDKVWAWA